MHRKPGHGAPEAVAMGKEGIWKAWLVFLQKSQINNESKLMGNHWPPYKLFSYCDFEQFEIETVIYFHIYVMS